MIIRTTIRDPAASAELDVEVTAEPETTIGSLLRAMPIAVQGRPCFVGAAKLDPEATVAGSPFVPGRRSAWGSQTELGALSPGDRRPRPARSACSRDPTRAG